MNKKELNNFDQLLKSKLDAHEMPFNPADWDKLESKLPQTKPLIKNPWLWSGAAAIIVVITSVAIWNTSKENVANTNQVIVSQPVSQETNKTVVTPLNDTDIKKVPIAEDNVTNEAEVIKKPIKDNTKKTETTASINSITEDPKMDKTPIVPLINDLSDKVDKTTTSTTSDIIQPTAFVVCKQTEQCLGKVVVFSTQSQKDVDYLWSFGDETFSKEQNPKHEYQKPGTYDVNLIVRSKKDNAILSKSEPQLITIWELPTSEFEFEQEMALGIPQTIFTNTNNRVTAVNWNFGDGSISLEKNPNHTFTRKGTYPVRLTTTNENGCTHTNTKNVVIEQDYNLLAPNSFTPNGDGLNDFFIPEALKVMDVNFSMSVFSPSGVLLFETKSVSNPWDGINNQNGEKCESDNYVWVVTLTNKEGKVEQYKGAVLILR